MEFVYTLHAEDQMKERKIHKIWVEDAITFPDKTERKENKYYVIKKLNGRTIKVVYVKENYIKIITSYFVK